MMHISYLRIAGLAAAAGSLLQAQLFSNVDVEVRRILNTDYF